MSTAMRTFRRDHDDLDLAFVAVVVVVVGIDLRRFFDIGSSSPSSFASSLSAV